MFGSETLEVAIGLILVYSLCSLVCSSINEWVSRLFDMRANDLETKIAELLRDRELVKKFYAHPIIQGVTRRTLMDRILRRHSKPSRISSKTFATALLDLLIKTGGAGEIKIGRDISVYRRRMLIDLEKGIHRMVGDRKDHILQAVFESVKTETGRIEDTVTNARLKFVEWFDDSMERMSRWYKQKTRIIIFIIAALISLTFNIDTIRIAKDLYYNNEVRQQIVDVAMTKAGETKTAVEIPSGTPAENVKKLKEQLSDLNLQFGWNLETNIDRDPTGLPVGFWQIMLKIIGLFITALAVAMGAPFWFDILRKMTGIRQEVKALEKEMQKT